jgi:hypothetical protein
MIEGRNSQLFNAPGFSPKPVSSAKARCSLGKLISYATCVRYTDGHECCVAQIKNWKDFMIRRCERRMAAPTARWFSRSAEFLEALKNGTVSHYGLILFQSRWNMADLSEAALLR